MFSGNGPSHASIHELFCKLDYRNISKVIEPVCLYHRLFQLTDNSDRSNQIRKNFMKIVMSSFTSFKIGLRYT